MKRSLLSWSAFVPLLISCTVTAPAWSQSTVQVASGLTNPLFVTAAPGDPSRLFIVEQGDAGSANIRILNLGSNTLNPTPFLTVTGLTHDGTEQGLLGMAFDPNYATNGKFYVNVTAPGGSFGNGITQIRQYTVSGDPNVSGTSFNTILSFDQPQENHNGGWIGFGPRVGETNYLYIATGDGGGSNDSGTGHVAGGNAQSTSNLLGKILRIDINATAGTYSIPETNPFDNEIFVLGLRNPFRASFDRLTGDLFIGDVGQSAREEIDRQLASNPNGGENYGWRLREGTIQTPTGGVGGLPPPGNVEPITDYDRSIGTTVTGGYVYRGSAVPSLYGKYIFGDFGTGRLFTMNPDGTDRQDVTALLDPEGALAINSPSSFGEDADGELYIVDYDGDLYKLIPEPGTGLLMISGIIMALATRRGCHRRQS
jgi:glucose/arabinose dehydrogenase